MTNAALLYCAAGAVLVLTLIGGWRHRRRPLSAPLALTGITLLAWLATWTAEPHSRAAQYLLISLWPALGLRLSIAARGLTGTHERANRATLTASLALALAALAWGGTFDRGLIALGLPAATGFDPRILLGAMAALLVVVWLASLAGLLRAHGPARQTAAGAALLVTTMLVTPTVHHLAVDDRLAALLVPAGFIALSALAWRISSPLTLPLRAGALRHTSEPLLVVDGFGRIQRATASALELLASERRSVIGAHTQRIIGLDWSQLQLLDHTLPPGHRHAVNLMDGSVLTLNVTLMHGPGGEPMMALLRLSRDQSAWLPAAPELRDADTGIPGVALGEALLEQAVLRGKDGNGPIAAAIFVRFGNLDEVRAEYGDALAIRWFNAVVARLSYGAAGEVLRSRDGGFATLITDPAEAEHAEQLAERLRAMLARPFLIDERSITPQVHVAVVPDLRQYASVDEVLADAHRALIGSGDEGEHRVHSTADAARQRGEQALNLEAALAGEALELRYDPVMDWRSRAGAGCRVRLRWDAEGLPPLHTAELLRTASRAHLVAPLINWLLKSLATNRAVLKPPQGEPLFWLPVEDALLSEVTHALHDRLPNSGLDGHLLILEVSAQSCTNPAWRQRFEALRELGVRLHLTDFSAQPLLALQAEGLPLHSAGLAPQLLDAVQHKRPGRHLVKDLAVTAHTIGGALRADDLNDRQVLDALGDADIKYLWGPALGIALDLDAAQLLMRAPGALHQRLGLNA